MTNSTYPEDAKSNRARSVDERGKEVRYMAWRNGGIHPAADGQNPEGTEPTVSD